jgi:hypothetical protein
MSLAHVSHSVIMSRQANGCSPRQTDSFIDEHGESASAELEELPSKVRETGMVEKVWQHTEGKLRRCTTLLE